MNILFVCSRNRLRSPTAESVFFATPGINVRSAGTAKDAENSIARDDIGWADLIFVMERHHRKNILEKFRTQTKIITLGIPDHYEFMDPDLIEMLQEKVTPHLERFTQMSRSGGA
jgi:predicted protein tyrosine phosphatase